MTESHTSPKKPAPRRRRRQRGITLLEIMIVLTIIGLVMALLVGPAAMRALFGSKVKTTKLEVRKFAFSAYTQWLGDHTGKNCPTSLSELTPYMESDTVNDEWGNPLQMSCESDKKTGHGMVLVVTSYGADGKPGGTGDDSDIVSTDMKPEED